MPICLDTDKTILTLPRPNMQTASAPPPAAHPTRQKIRLGDLLVQQKVISSADLEVALVTQKKSGRRLGRVIVESGMAGENDIAQALARQLAIPFVDLRKFSPEPAILQLLPETQARRFRAIPLARKDGDIFVGMADPTDLSAYDEVARLIQEGIQLAVVSEGDLLAAIDRLGCFRARAEDGGGAFKQLFLPFSDLVGVKFKLAAQLGHRLVFAQGCQRHACLECRVVGAAGAPRRFLDHQKLLLARPISAQHHARSIHL